MATPVDHLVLSGEPERLLPIHGAS